MAKGLTAVDLRSATEEELDTRLADAKIELFNLRFQAATGQLDNPMRVKEVRHDIARILTVLRDRQTEEDLAEAVARADRESLGERRQAIASGELKGRSLTEMAEEARIEQEAAAGATAAPDEEGEAE